MSWTCAEYLWVFLESFQVVFEVLHTQSLSPINFASFELQNTNTWKTLVHWLCCSSNTKNHLEKWAMVHFPYNLPLFGD
jgi:hypothetical protein